MRLVLPLFGCCKSDTIVGNTRRYAVIIHGRSVKGIERVVRCCNENANKMSS